MAIFASLSTITTQTTPLIKIDPATVNDSYLLVWDSQEGAFVAKQIPLPDSFSVDLENNNLIGTLPADKGGTGIDNYADGDLLYGNNDDTLSKLSIGNQGQILKVDNGFPKWSDVIDIPNIKYTIYSEFTTGSQVFDENIPLNGYITDIKVYIDSVYNQGVSISLSDGSDDILTSDDIKPQNEGIYVYKIDKFYQNGSLLYAFINNATQGKIKFFIEYQVI